MTPRALHALDLWHVGATVPQRYSDLPIAGTSADAKNTLQHKRLRHPGLGLHGSTDARSTRSDSAMHARSLRSIVCLSLLGSWGWPKCYRFSEPISAHPSHASWPHRELHRRPKWLSSHAPAAPTAHPSHVSWPHRELHRRPKWIRSHAPLTRLVARMEFHRRPQWRCSHAVPSSP